MFFFVWFFVPETKGMSLEAMDELFGGAPAGQNLKNTQLNENADGNTTPPATYGAKDSVGAKSTEV